MKASHFNQSSKISQSFIENITANKFKDCVNYIHCQTLNMHTESYWLQAIFPLTQSLRMPHVNTCFPN